MGYQSSKPTFLWLFDLESLALLLENEVFKNEQSVDNKKVFQRNTEVVQA